MIRAATLVVLVAVCATSCGQLTGATTGNELEATCGSVKFDGVRADWSDFPPLGDVEREIDLTVVAEEREFFDDYDWYVAEEGRRSLHLFGVARDAHEDPTGMRYAGAEFERTNDSWVPRSWGQCRIEVSASGWGNARFVLDPNVEPDPASTSIFVQAWEMACAAGRAPEGRDVEAVVLAEDGDSVSVVILVEPVRGGADCQGNPSFPFEVDLAEPLGDRTVRDASFDPPAERPWPPTETSLDFQGLEE